MGLIFSDVIEPGTKIKFKIEDEEKIGKIEAIETLRSQRLVDSKKLKRLSKKSSYFQNKFLSDCYYVVSGLRGGNAYVEIGQAKRM